MAQNIRPRLEEGLHYLQGDVLIAEWSLLIGRLWQFGRVDSVSRTIHAGAEAELSVLCAEDRLPQLDRVVMACLVVDPLYREKRPDGYHITVKFRTWWRRSVPFLLDPDGERHQYRYEVQKGRTEPEEEL